MQLIYKLFDRG